MPIRGLVFDLDGTLVDSALDFDCMRREMGLPRDQPILESLERLPPTERARCQVILERHELAGAARAALMPGVVEFLQRLDSLGLRCAILTRNSRSVTEETLRRLNLRFSHVVAREDAPIKPDPTALHRLRDDWRLAVDEMAIVGDYVYDLEAGRRAGIRTVLYTRGRPAESLAYHHLADFVLSCFRQPEALLSWLDAPHAQSRVC